MLLGKLCKLIPLSVLGYVGGLQQQIHQNMNIIIRKYTPRRAIMYVPGDDKRKLRKAAQVDVDCIALDCEDGVSIYRKEQARDTIRAFFDSGTNNPPAGVLDKRKRSEWAVRINSVDSGMCNDDLKTILSGVQPPSTILLPKVDRVQHFNHFADCVEKYLSNDKKINLIFYAESCRSIMDLPKLCQAAIDLSKESNGKFLPVGIIFGSDDFCASLGATRSEDSKELLYARQRVVMIAKAFDFQAIDMVFIRYKDLEGLKIQSESGARMGYTGKQVIHPGQIDIVHNAFLPSADKVEWARGLVHAFNLHQKSGKGAFVYQNNMIDMPTMRQAENILATMRNVEIK